MNVNSNASNIVKIVFLFLFVPAVIALTAYSEAKTKPPGTYPLSIDFYAFWSGFQIMQEGNNYYDHRLLLSQESQFSTHTSGPIYYPPWMLPILTPILSLSFPLSVSIFAAFNVALLMGSGLLAWKLSSRNALEIERALFAAFFFIPTINALQFGQLSLLVTFSIYLAFYLFQKGRHILAGSLIALITIKPHLSFLLLSAFAIELINKRIFTPIIAGGLTMAAVIGAVEVSHPGIMLKWLDAIGGTTQHAPASLLTPLREISLYLAPGIVPYLHYLLPGMALVITLTLKLKGHLSFENIQTLPLLLFFSILCAPYIWIFDHSGLLILQVATVAALTSARGSRQSATLIFLFAYQSFVLYLQILNILDHRLWWYPVPILMVWLSVLRGNNSPTTV